ncbi:MAG: NHL repeat-containing protein [bacterium]
MLSKKLILCAAVLTLAGVLAGCGPDTEGNGGPIAGTRIWIADQPDSEVVIYDDTGNLLKFVGGPGIFSKPNAIDVYAKDGAAWVCDFYTNRIRKFDAGGNPLYASPDPEVEALVLNAADLSVSQSSAECWISDRGNNRVLRLDADGNVLAKVSGFKYPRGISADPVAGDVWVADEGNDAVVKVAATATGNISVRAVEVGRFTGMENPWAVAADADGKGWASSRVEGRVVRLSVDAAELASVEGFDAPVALAVAETAKVVYVVDTGKGLLVALPRGVTGTHKNYAAVATFVVSGLAHPEDVFVDEKTGRIYVAEMGGGNVKIYDRDGKLVNTISGFSGPAALAVWSEN